ncbi:hypothetical protein SAICODRAFT_4852 [Saitoella complicata NRRL Y-17804]|nr:uncharacterized protein SAICODRAFT_4852 [Saitoella complicata NRRL Y-17804]ODQ55613.1 hypothetical protein SAICODRAFT_4852 [Saitoella complicata NRRL Y-17804]
MAAENKAQEYISQLSQIEKKVAFLLRESGLAIQALNGRPKPYATPNGVASEDMETEETMKEEDVEMGDADDLTPAERKKRDFVRHSSRYMELLEDISKSLREQVQKLEEEEIPPATSQVGVRSMYAARLKEEEIWRRGGEVLAGIVERRVGKENTEGGEV